MPLRRRGFGGFKIRIIIAIAVAAFTLFKYYSKSQYNEITGEKQHIDITTKQEIMMGLQSAPHMAQQHGGIHSNRKFVDLVKQIGNDVVVNSAARNSDYKFDFHLLADPRSINAFALPGGQIFMTYALFSKLKSKDQLAGVLGHEIGHVIARHSAEQIAKQSLTQGLTGAAVVMAGDYNSSQMAGVIANLINMKYSRSDELEADELGVRFMVESGYNPKELIGVMKILEASSSGNRPPEFQSSHPSPKNRIQKIKQAIKKYSK